MSKLPDRTGEYGQDFINQFYRNLGAKEGAFSLKEVTTEYVDKMLGELNITKATGLDGIGARFLKDASPVIAPYITHIINLSLRSGDVPIDFKHAKVTPIYKKGIKSDPSNYRPVSILSVISKVFERVVHDQLYDYINSNNLFYDMQSGFRKSCSTDTCLLFITDFIKKEIDQGKLCGLVLLDLQKAFDTVDHNILLSKLKALGLDGPALRWLRSYLTGRDQRVDVGGVLSDAMPISCGVPQGSVLGPLLFLLYINDMKAACSSSLFLYADDSAILVSHKDKEVIQNILAENLEKMRIWLSDNRLSLHLGKTEALLLGSQKRLQKEDELVITTGGTKITSQPSVKYLGCFLDSTLNGSIMAKNVLSKVNARTRFLARKSTFLNKECLKILASCLVQCHFDYAINSWFWCLSKELQRKMQTAQNRLMRVVLGLNYRSHIGKPQFIQLQWLPVEERARQLQLTMVHKILNNKAPRYFNNYFRRVNHGHNTRGSLGNVSLYKHKGKSGELTFLYRGAVDWNTLPLPIKETQSPDTFRAKVRKLLFSGLPP